MIRVSGLVKKFNGFTAVKNISFEVKEGEVFGLVGPNGAGKSTIVKMLCTILEPSEGTGTIKDFDIRTDAEHIRKIVGYLPEEPRVYDYMTAIEYLRLFASMYNVNDDKIIELMKHFDVAEHTNRLMGDLSKGLRQRVSICRALLHNPDVLILDEPTMGLDPASARELREKIFELKKHGKTIIICTHYMDEADYLCDKVCIINDGTIVAIDTPERLKQRIKKTCEIGVVFAQNEDTEILLKQFEKTNSLKKHGRAYVFTGKEHHEILRRILELAKQFDLKIEKLYTIEPTLEDVFVSLVKNKKTSNYD